MIKPNRKQTSCVQIETLSQDIIQATKDLVLRHQRTEVAGSGENNSELSLRVEQLSKDNKLLISQVESLQKAIESLAENLKNGK